jgi:NAD(P)-dependent dehydrogenase (short-subunit alcohol dehydrogenase family)
LVVTDDEMLDPGRRGGCDVTAAARDDAIASPFDLQGKVAVVTGGSRGLGRAMVQAFAEHGADVVIASRRLDTCETVAEQVAASAGCQTMAAQFHAARWADADGLVDLVYERFGRCDVLVNNAGSSPLYPSLSEVSESLFDKVVGVNLKGPFRLSALIGQRMMEAGQGSIINVSSIAAVQPRPTELVYAAAKAALNSLTIGLARAYAPRVRVNAIMAGPFLTDIAKAWDPDGLASMAAAIPMGRIGRPDEVVGAALYLASDVASYTTGAIVKVDGGWSYAPA